MHKIADFLAALGPLGVFAMALLDSLGVPLPAVIDVTLLAVAAKTPSLAYWAAIAASSGSLIGNLGLFSLSRAGVRRFMKPPDPAKQQRFRTWFHRYGLITVFVPAVVPFIPLPLKAFVISAGIFHTPLARFAAVIVAARVLRYFGQAWLGIRLGDHAGEFLRANAWTITGVAVLLALLAVGLIKWKTSRLGELA